MRNKEFDDAIIEILEDDEEPNPLYGMEANFITPKMINALLHGKRLYMPVNDEYAVVLKYKDTGRLIRDYSKNNLYASHYLYCTECGAKFLDTIAEDFTYCPRCGIKLTDN